MFTEVCKVTDLGHSTQKFTLKQPFGLASLNFRPQKPAKIRRNERILDREMLTVRSFPPLDRIVLKVRG